MLLYSCDVLTVADNYMKVSEIWIRINTDKIEHKRVVFGFMDWLGALGGVGEIIIVFFSSIFNYLFFR